MTVLALRLAHADAPEAAEHTIAHALESFRLADEALTIELVANEPDVIDPVAIAWDEAGRMYVAEMRDYPLGPPCGTVRLLEDTDGDGRYEKATLFAEGLPFPNSVMPWRGGVFVSAAPDILYLKDTDGDGKADERKVVLTGFAEGNQQLRVNSLHLGLDGWVYAANGRSDGVVRHPDEPADKAVPLRRHDLRFNPDTFAFEPIAGFSQFGLCHDDWGNRFLSWNTVPIRQAMLEESDLAHNPLLASTTVEAVISDPADTGRIYPIAQPVPRFNRESVEFFNASCGLTIYRGDQLEGLRGDAFVCEPLSSLVHHKRLTPQGATFVATRVEQGKEFLASTDAWFRPVNLATGPDGNLYVVDFARKWVEHPNFVPKEFRETTDWRTGDSLGRIWRVRRKDKSAPSGNFTGATSTSIVDHLENPNGWVRDTAQRLLIERNDPDTRPLLEEAVLKGAQPYMRIQALHTLDVLGWHAEDLLNQVAATRDANVRQHIALLAPRWTTSEKKLAETLTRLAGDSSASVRLQALRATAGLGRDLRSSAILAASQEPADEWLTKVILCNAADNAFEVLKAILPKYDASGATLRKGLAELVGASNDASTTAELVATLAKLPLEMALPVVAGLARGMDRAHLDVAGIIADPALRASLNGYTTSVITSDWFATELRLEAIDLVRRGLAPAAVAKLAPTVKTTQSEPVRIAAIQAIAWQADTTTLKEFFASWDTLPVGARRAIVQASLAAKTSANALLDAIEAKQITPLEVDAQARETLAKYPDDAIKTRAGQVLGNSGTNDRAEVLARYAPSLTLAGDDAKGAETFAQNCMPCHMHQGKGNRVGPDLSGIASRGKEQLLSDILNPSAEVAPDFTAYTAVTADLEVITGVLAGETAANITLHQAQGVEQVIPTAGLQELRASQLSLMPGDFENTLDTQAVADLLSFLRGEKYASGTAKK